MKMNNREKRILDLCLLYIAYVFLYGIVIKFTMFNSALFQIKTYIPELILGLVMVQCIAMHGIRLKRISVYLLGYSLIVASVNFALYGINSQAMYLVRDIYIPLVTFMFLMTMRFSKNGIHYFVSRLVVFCKFYLVSGLLLAVIEQIKGWEWSSIFYTGYSFYGQDPVSKIKIAHNFGILRVPSLSGNFATFGYYCLIAVLLIEAYTKKRSKRFFWSFIAVLCMILATNKSAIVAFAAVLILRKTVNIRKNSLRANGIILVMLAGLIGCSALFLLGDNSGGSGLFTSVFTRFRVWKNIFTATSWAEVLFPYKQFTYGTGADGILGFWDNTYLYCLFTQGIVGTILWVSMLRNVYKNQMKHGDSATKRFVRDLTLVLLVLGMTVNITQGRGFLSLYLVLIGIGCTMNS